MANNKDLNSAIATATAKLTEAIRNAQSSFAVFARDAAHGLLEVSHNGFALLGLLVVGSLLFVSSRSDLRHEIEASTLGWLQERQEARTEPDLRLAAELSEPDAVARATATDPKEQIGRASCRERV